MLVHRAVIYPIVLLGTASDTAEAYIGRVWRGIRGAPTRTEDPSITTVRSRKAERRRSQEGAQETLSGSVSECLADIQSVSDEGKRERLIADLRGKLVGETERNPTVPQILTLKLAAGISTMLCASSMGAALYVLVRGLSPQLSWLLALLVADTVEQAKRTGTILPISNELLLRELLVRQSGRGQYDSAKILAMLKQARSMRRLSAIPILVQLLVRALGEENGHMEVSSEDGGQITTLKVIRMTEKQRSKLLKYLLRGGSDDVVQWLGDFFKHSNVLYDADYLDWLVEQTQTMASIDQLRVLFAASRSIRTLPRPIPLSLSPDPKFTAHFEVLTRAYISEVYAGDMGYEDAESLGGAVSLTSEPSGRLIELRLVDELLALTGCHHQPSSSKTCAAIVRFAEGIAGEMSIGEIAALGAYQLLFLKGWTGQEVEVLKASTGAPLIFAQLLRQTFTDPKAIRSFKSFGECTICKHLTAWYLALQTEVAKGERRSDWASQTCAVRSSSAREQLGTPPLMIPSELSKLYEKKNEAGREAIAAAIAALFSPLPFRATGRGVGSMPLEDAVNAILAEACGALGATLRGPVVDPNERQRLSI